MLDSCNIDIGKYIKVISNLLDSNANQEFRKWDLTGSQHSIIVYLLDHQSNVTTQRDLEEIFSLKNPTVTGLLDLLEKKGLVRRVPNPADRRSNSIELTEKSLALKSELFAGRGHAEEQMLQGFSNEEKRLFESFMIRLRNNVQKLVKS